MKRIMMIGLVVFGGTQGIHGMSWFNRAKPVKPTRQQLGNLTPAFLTSIFNIQSRSVTTQLWESDLAAKKASAKARNSLSGFGDSKYSRLFGAGQESPRRSWMPNPNSPRLKFKDTLTRNVHSDVLAMYGA
ncbi:MAG: hypothetical protein ACHQVS_04115 [Candidatus Babeliales bacterium]